MAKKEVNAKNENKVKKHFLKEMKAELKRVTWPTQKQLVNNTIAVVVIVLIIVAIVFVLDTVFDLMNQYGITKLQSYVVEQFKEDEKSENDNQNSSDENNNSTDSEKTENQENTSQPTDTNPEDTNQEQNTNSNEQ